MALKPAPLRHVAPREGGGEVVVELFVAHAQRVSKDGVEVRCGGHQLEHAAHRPGAVSGAQVFDRGAGGADIAVQCQSSTMRDIKDSGE